jgi:hypothetical protein
MNKTITLLIIGVIFLALLLMVLNAVMKEGRQGVPAPLAEKTRVLEERSAPVPSAPHIAPQSVESATAALAPAAEGVTVKTVPAQIDAGQTTPASQPPQAAAPARPKVPAIPEPEVKRTSGGAKHITSIVVYATQEGATLRLAGDRPLVCKAMLLRNPDRLALDFEGQWNVDIPGIPQNKLVKAIRVGRQADSTRMVVDLHRAPASYRLIKTSPQMLDVRLR